MVPVPRLTSAASADLVAGYQWYEHQVPGLGKGFVRAADDALTFVAAHPDIFPAFHRGLRRVLLRRFPYAVYYRVGPSDIEVVAIFHTAMDPRRLADRT